MAEETLKNKELITSIESNLTALEKIRKNFEPQIDDIIRYIYHGRRGITETAEQKGQKTGQHVYDGTALNAVNLLTDGLTGYTMSKGFTWFRYTLPLKVNFARTSSLRSSSGGRRLDSFPEVKRWLEDTQEAMNAAFLASNFYDIGPDFVRDAATIGTVTINADEDIENGRTMFSVPHFRECFIAENYVGSVDTNIRVRKLSLKQLVEKFGWEKMIAADPNFKEQYKKDRNAEKEVIHARYPRKDRDPSKMNGGNKKFASVWILRSPKKLLLDSGTDVRSFTTWRWRKNQDEWYGRSPAWDAFVEVMTANQMGRSNLIAGHKMVEPAMVGPSDLRGEVRSGPKGWTWVDDMNHIPRPLVENIQLPFGIELQDRMDQKIRDHFHVDFFLLLSQAALQKVELTATQVVEMTGEKAAVLGPRVGRMGTEALTPIHDMMFNIENRAGRIPVPPDILFEFAGANIEIEYLGPLAQAQQKLFRMQGIQQGLSSVAAIADMAPEVLDNINFDQTAKDLLGSTGFPQKDMNDDETVKAIRMARQAQIQQQQQFDAAIQTAKAMPAAGKEISPNSAAGMLIEGAA